MLKFFLDHSHKEKEGCGPVTDALIRLVLDSGFSSSTAAYVLAWGLFILVEKVVPEGLLTGWLLGMTAIFALRLAATRCYEKEAKDQGLTSSSWVKAYAGLVFLTGVFWGVAVFFFFPPGAMLEQMGLVFIALAGPGKFLRHWRFNLGGDRDAVRQRAAAAALRLTLKKLNPAA